MLSPDGLSVKKVPFIVDVTDEMDEIPQNRNQPSADHPFRGKFNYREKCEKLEKPIEYGVWI